MYKNCLQHERIIPLNTKLLFDKLSCKCRTCDFFKPCLSMDILYQDELDKARRE